MLHRPKDSMKETQMRSQELHGSNKILPISLIITNPFHLTLAVYARVIKKTNW